MIPSGHLGGGGGCPVDAKLAVYCCYYWLGRLGEVHKVEHKNEMQATLHSTVYYILYRHTECGSIIKGQ